MRKRSIVEFPVEEMKVLKGGCSKEKPDWAAMDTKIEPRLSLEPVKEVW